MGITEGCVEADISQLTSPYVLLLGCNGREEKPAGRETHLSGRAQQMRFTCGWESKKPQVAVGYFLDDLVGEKRVLQILPFPTIIFIHNFKCQSLRVLHVVWYMNELLRRVNVKTSHWGESTRRRFIPGHPYGNLRRWLRCRPHRILWHLGKTGYLKISYFLRTVPFQIKAYCQPCS